MDAIAPLRRWWHGRRFRSLAEKYRRYSMIPTARYIENLALCRRWAPPGLVVECGVWRGGMIAGIAEVLGPDRAYHLFDSFEGLPAADPVHDGPAAVAYQADPTGPTYFDNCRAEIAWAEDAMRQAGVPRYHIVKGWFAHTLVDFTPVEPVAVLRLDADWYEPTRRCLEALYPHVATRGLIILDDYYDWDGCTNAVHDYFAQRQLPERIRHTPHGVAFIVKVSRHYP